MKKVFEFVLIVVAAFLKGFIFSKMWLWFVVPTFRMPTLSLANAVGICGMVSLLQLSQTVAIVWPQIAARLIRDPKGTVTQADWDEWGDLLQSLFNTFLFYPLAFLLAWIVSLFL